MGKKSREKKVRPKQQPDAATPPGRSFPLWLLFAIGALAFLVYARCIPFEFVYDDESQILQNPWIRDWSAAIQAFTSDVWAFARAERQASNYYRPLHMLANTLGYSFSALKPHGYHAIGILLHVTCTLLVVLFGFRLFRDLWVCASAGLIFALHPIHVESVAWIAGVTDPLCAIFYLGALFLHLLDISDEKHITRRAAIAVLFLLSLLSKEMAFTFPIAALLLEWCLKRKIQWSRYLPIAGSFAVYLVLRITALHGLFSRNFGSLDVKSQILTTIVLVGDYLTKLVVPYNLIPYHLFHPTTNPFGTEFLLRVVALAGFLWLGWKLRGDGRVIFLFGFCILTLLPVLNLQAIGETKFADRYLYIPSIGSSLLFPKIAEWFWTRRPGLVHWPPWQAAATALALLLSAYGWKLWDTCSMWQNDFTLYSEIVRQSPDASLMLYNLAGYHFSRGEFNKSEELYGRSLEAYRTAYFKTPQREAAIYTGLGEVYYQKTDYESARKSLLMAYDLRPDDPVALQILGSISVASQDYGNALKYFNEALKINPSEIAFNNLAAVYLTTRDLDKSIDHAKKALALSPGYGDAYMNLGRAYAAKGMKAEARSAYLNAIKVDPKKTGAAQADLQALESTAP
jgi:protein O-mannosyl-transferase